MSKYYKPLLFLAACVVVFVLFRAATGPRGAKDRGASIDPSVEPQQVEVTDVEPIWIKFSGGRAELRPFATYTVAVKIGGRKRYWGKWQSDVARYDLLLMWGDLATKDIPELKFKQEMRWSYFRYGPNCPYDADYIGTHSSNTHIIPASNNLRRAVSRLGKGDIVLMEGYLIDLDGEYEGRQIWWNSSRTRDDTGNGACEVFYLTSLRNGRKVYR